MKKYEYQRGAILVESALVVGAIFLMLFGTVYLSIIGFDQMSADGASYEVAHQASVGASAPPAQAAHATFPNIPQNNITTTVEPAPNSSIAVDYGYNDSNGVTAYNSSNDRHGGVGIMQGTSISGSANKNSASILGMPINVVGTMIEPMWLENGLHFNADNSNNYGGAANVCATPPPSNPNQAPRCFQGNVFSQGENAPQYFTSNNILVTCSSNLPWATGYGPVDDGSTSACTASQENYIPMGMAEFLDLTNWCPASGATSPCVNTPAGPGLTGTQQSQATFADINCHQHTYKIIADFFAKYGTLTAALTHQVPSNPLADQLGGYNNTDQSLNAPGPPYYYYALRDPTNTTSQGQYPSNSFQVFAGFDTPASGENLTNPSAAVSGVTDMAIRKVYSWDGATNASPGAPNPLYPDNGCSGA